MHYVRDIKVVLTNIGEPDGRFSWVEIYDFLIDTDSDVATLPGKDSIRTGSMALSLQGKVFALVDSGWQEVKNV